MGLGSKNTALDVKIELANTHTTGLPIGVCIQCREVDSKRCFESSDHNLIEFRSFKLKSNFFTSLKKKEKFNFRSSLKETKKLISRFLTSNHEDGSVSNTFRPISDSLQKPGKEY